LRYFYEGLGNVAKALEPLTNEAALIKMGQGKVEVTDDMAMNIENKLGLPAGWMDRDNEMILRRMTENDYDLLRVIANIPQESKTALISFLHTLPLRISE
jgi:hypothetical protein